jgi:hypothetical protein
MTYPPQDPNQQPYQPHPQQPGIYPPPGQPYPPQQPGMYPPPGYPPAPPPKKGMSTGNVLLIIAASFIGLCCVGGIISVAISGGKTSNSSRTTGDKQPVAAAPSAAAPQTKAPPAKKANAKVGQPVRDGKFEFVAQKVDCGKTQVGGQFFNKTAQGQFCLVTVSVKNISDKPQMFDGSDQKAAGAGGVKYTHDGVAETYANDNTQTFLNQINPGNQVTGVLVFDIPQGAALTSVELHDSMFSSGVTVDVN